MVERSFSESVGLTVLLLCLFMGFVNIDAAKPKDGLIQRINDLKDFKKFVKTRTNVLVLFAKSERQVSDSWTTYVEVADQMKGLASVVFVDCSIDKKLCKKLKSSTESFELKHYKDGEFHKVYDRKMTIKSITNFLKDPKGEIPWEEDSSATDVLHLDTRGALSKLLGKETKPILLMFYAPWCGYCKKLKPEFSAAASELKGDAVLAGMDVDRPENTIVRSEFNITGFPTLVYFEEGQIKFRYGGENSKDGIVNWMKSPSAPKEPEKEVAWSETESDVVHLTDSTFDEVLSSNPSVLIMFYAPWCGHCKKMKPEYQQAAAQMKEENIVGVLAAVDATAEKQIAGRFQVKGYPTVKYFKNGTEAWEVSERTSDKIVEFMKDPQEPPPPPAAEAAWEEIPSHVHHLNDDLFKTFLKKKRHTLVMFYAPWCGHCKRAKPEYMNAAEKFKDDTKVAFAAVDCTKYGSLCSSNEVSGYPTFKYFNYGKNDQKYAGGREEADFVAFMNSPLSPLTSSTPPVPEEKSWSDIPGNENVLQLTEDTFDSSIAQHASALVMFYAPWCKHCTAMKPAFVEAATLLKAENFAVVFGAVDLTTETGFQSRFKVKGYPTIKYFINGQEAFDYDRGRSAEDFVSFMHNPTPFAPVPNWMNEPGNVHHLVSTNFTSILSAKQQAFVMFYVPWCPHCQKAKPNFWEVAEKLKDRTDLWLAAMDCSETKNGEICYSLDVKGYPAFKYFANGKSVASYEGDRNAADLLSFVSNPPHLKKAEL